MKKQLKLLISSAMIVLTFASSQAIHGMEEEQKDLPRIQLNRGTDGTLEKVLGTGDNVLLKMSINLDTLKQPLEKGQLEVPVRLFLTDFMSSPTQHLPIEFKVKVDYASTPPACIVPGKPPSFDSYAQFTDWLSHGYFTSQIRIIYNFHIDIQQSAPSLVQQLFSVPPGGYRFTGTHAIESARIKADQCVPQVTWSSRRGNTNVTILTLGGTFYLNDCPYPIDSHDQIFPHQAISEIAFKRVKTKRFHSHKWLTQSETTTKVTYAEFPRDQIKKWPDAPSGIYNLLRTQLDYVREDKHVACWDGKSGKKEVDIPDGRIFRVVHDAIPTEAPHFLESIVKDHDENLYTIRTWAAAISSLTDTVLHEIFLNLDFQALKSTAKVSKHFNMLASKIFRTFPPIARGHEEIYQRFLKGVLVYRPVEGSDDGMVKLPISGLENPLEGTFDLSQCGDTGQYLSISTGYRKKKKAENENKVEIWFSPRFLVENELNTTAKHFQVVYSAWKENATVGIFWTVGNWDDLSKYYYLITQNMDELSANNIMEKNANAEAYPPIGCFYAGIPENVVCARRKFHIYF